MHQDEEKPMKILFVTTLDLQIHTFHERTIKALAEEGNLVDAATNGTDITEGMHQKYTVPFNRNPLNPSNFRAKNQLRALIRENGYDIISCHSPSAGFYGRWAAKGLDTHVIYTAHGFHFWKGAPLINRVVYKNMERLAAHWTDTLVTINPEDYEAASSFHYKPHGDPVYIKGVGVDVKGIKALKCDKAEIRKELGLSEEDFVLYSIGELIPRKNHRFIIDALKEQFQKNPRLHYCIAGSGKLQDELQEYINDNHLEHQVHLLGFRRDARKLMYGMDVFVFPSKQEGLPVAVMEAMAAGLPVIASDIRGSHDLIHDHVNGLLYPFNDTAAFQSALDQLMQSPSAREALGAKAQIDAQQYSIETIEPQILALYKKEGQ